MYQKQSLLAFVPARAGSKGLPDKNILACAGRPLIEWTIAAAKAVRVIDDVLVSTDSEPIAAIARRAGASVPFLRPSELATDDASLGDAVKHAWRLHSSADGGRYDYVIVLQPTSPLRTADHIGKAIDHYFRSRLTDFDTLVSVCEVDRKFGWLMQGRQGAPYVDFCMSVSLVNPRRQLLQSLYLPNGAIFIVRGDRLEHGFYGDKTLPFVMPSEDSIDVDTAEDLRRAEGLLNQRQHMRAAARIT